MPIVVDALRGLVLLFEISILAPLLYLLLLSAGALLQLRRATVIPSRAWAEFYDALPAFAVLVEDRGSPWDVRVTLESIAKLDYPAHRYATIVVTDSGGDALGEIAREAEVALYERRGSRNCAETDALCEALNDMIVSDEHFDAYVVVGSGSRLSVAYLRHMASALESGVQVAQARMCPAGDGEGWRVTADALTSALFDYLRPLGRAYFGWSVGCRGDGVCFANDVAQLLGWDGGSGDDAERSLRLAQAGIAVAYIDGAMVFTDRPSTAHVSTGAWLRTLRRRVDMLAPERGLSPLLHRQGHLLLRLDAALELVLPPLPILAGLIALGITLSWALAWVPALAVGLLAALALAAHLATGIALADLAWREYLSLGQAPLMQARLWLERFVQSHQALQSAPHAHAHLARLRGSSLIPSAPGTARATDLEARLPDVPRSVELRTGRRKETGAWQTAGETTMAEARTPIHKRGA